MIPRFFIRLALLISLSSLSLADQLTLTNGDRLTGSVVKSDATTVTFKPELAGTVEIKWSAIKELVSDKPLAVTSTAAPQPLAGTVTKDGSVTVPTSPTNSKTIAQSDIVALRTPAEQTEYEKSLHPALYRGWKGELISGLHSQAETARPPVSRWPSLQRDRLQPTG